MAISLDSIYKPITDFFSKKFDTDNGDSTFFRFDKFGSVISDKDFINPVTGTGYSPEIAREKFSDIVNHIPIKDDDGISIEFSVNVIDDAYYYRLLSPSDAYIPKGTEAKNAESIVKSYVLIKDKAISLWEDISAESLSGLMLQIKPSIASPENWYDISSKDLWSSYSFQVADSNTPQSSPRNVLQWKSKVSEEKFQNILATSAAKPTEAAAKPLRPAITLAVAKPVTIATHHSRVMIAEESPKAAPKVDTAMNIRFADLEVSKRILANRQLFLAKPTQQVKTNSFSISFDWCLVKIQRPWFFSIFMYDQSWCIPNVSKGQFSKDNSGQNLSCITTGFVAIKNLKIKTNWNQNDIEASKVATDFGPFKVDSGITDASLSHDGIQIIGWMLQRLPDLPPNSDPNLNSNSN